MAIIAICRGTKSGGAAMAECLARHLDYPIVGRDVVQEAAARLDVPAELLEEKMGGRPTLWDRFSSLRRTYVVAVQAALAERAVEGNLVYHGLAGGLLLQGLPSLLWLRLIAPMPVRVRTVMDAGGMEAPMAERYIRELDDSRSRWVHAMYGEDVTDAALYDLVVNLEHMTIAGACAVVVKTIEQPEYDLTDDVRSRLRDFRTACRVKRVLVEDPELRAMELDARAEDGRVVISGEAPLLKSGRMGERIVDLARSVPEVDEVQLNVEWFDPYP